MSRDLLVEVAPIPVKLTNYDYDYVRCSDDKIRLRFATMILQIYSVWKYFTVEKRTGAGVKKHVQKRKKTKRIHGFKIW
jgi:hypothetical protein